MARITEKGLSGRIGPVVYYEMNGKQYARARPQHKKKRSRAATHPAASLFGICSGAATTAGHILQASLDFPFKLKSFNLLRGWLFKQYKLHQEQSNWHLGYSFVPACQLNPAADLRNFLFVPIETICTTTGSITVHIPSFHPVQQIANPLRAVSVHIRIMVMGLVLEKGNGTTFFKEQTIPLVFQDGVAEATELLFEDAQIQPGTIFMVVVSLTYIAAQQQVIKNEEYLPAAVVGLGKVRVM